MTFAINKSYLIFFLGESNKIAIIATITLNKNFILITPKVFEVVVLFVFS